MLNRYYHHDPENKGSQIHKVPSQNRMRNIQICVDDKGFRGKPITKKTCVEFLERDDKNPGFLTSAQRETLKQKAGERYKKNIEPKKRKSSKKYDPFDKLNNETVEDYAVRINELIQKQ